MDNNNNRRIVVLDDGETWSEAGYVAEVTDKAYAERPYFKTTERIIAIDEA